MTEGRTTIRGAAPGRALAAVLLVTALVHLPNLASWFFSDDVLRLAQAQAATARTVARRFLDLFIPGRTAWPFPTTSLQFWVGARLGGELYPVHALLALAPHLGLVACVFCLARATSGDVRVGAIAALLCGIGPSSAHIGWLSVGHHVHVTLAIFGAALAYTWYLRRPGPVPVAALLAAVALGLGANEAGVLAAAQPLLLEAARPDLPDCALRPRARARAALATLVTVVAGYWLLCNFRLTAILGQEPLRPLRPDRYTLGVTPAAIAEHLAKMVELASGLPGAAVVLVLPLAVAGLVAPRTRRAARHALALAALLVVPYAPLAREPSAWYGYTPSAAIALVEALGLVALWDAGRDRRTARLARTLAASALTAAVCWSLVQVGRCHADLRSAGRRQRSLVEVLRARVPRGAAPTVVWVSAPGRSPHQIISEYQPTLALDVFLRGHPIDEVWIFIDEQEEQLERGRVRYLHASPRPPGERRIVRVSFDALVGSPAVR